MRILIAGAGAFGSVFGGFLRKAGHHVALLGRGQHLDAIAAHGLSIDGLWGEHHVDGFELFTQPPEDALFDALLISVKSYDTAAMARAITPLLDDAGTAISLQNGLGNVEQLVELVGPERALGGRVIFGATLPHPGQVRVTVFAEPTLLGAWPTSHPSGGNPRFAPAAVERARRWAETIAAAGVPAEPCADVEAALWGKVFYNAALNPLGALLGVHSGALPENPETRRLMDRVIDEAHAVAVAEGVRIPWATPDDYRKLFYGRLVPSTFDHRSSMLQDLERGRLTEIDAINGAVWKRAQSHGMNAPFNEVLTRLMHARESMRRGAGE